MRMCCALSIIMRMFMTWFRMMMSILMFVLLLRIVTMLYSGFAFTTSTYCTHYSTSSSLIRICSPALTSNVPLPQSGQTS
ncbi:secreted protein [methanotrophic bacterial endosymbiont of Bathymodiolus sp.]|nr:secreted protein [methanotrophic bacterial endosymbiont of Bathymodiolus sp.]